MAFALRLCAEEALANVVTHAWAEGDHRIVLGLAVAADQVELTVEDDGRPFDPVAAPAPAQAATLADAAAGGRGLILIRSYADRLAYRREGGRNRLIMGFMLTGGKSGLDR